MKVTLKGISIIVGLVIGIGGVCVSTGVFIGNTQSNAVRIEEKIDIFSEVNKEEHVKIEKSLNQLDEKMDIVIDTNREKIEIAKGE